MMTDGQIWSMWKEKDDGFIQFTWLLLLSTNGRRRKFSSTWPQQNKRNYEKSIIKIL